MQCKPHIQAFNPTPPWFVERAGFLHGLNLFQRCLFLPLAAGDTGVASSHCSTAGKSRGSGQELFQHLWRWLVPSLGFPSPSRLIFPGAGTQCQQDSAVGTRMECAEDPRVFWEAAAVGVAYKKLSWECCRECCGLEESSSAFMVCMKGKSPAALVWTEIPGVNRKGWERLFFVVVV